MSTKDGTKDEHSELRTLLPHILQAMHANNHWESVKSAEEIRCDKFANTLPCPSVRLLRPPANSAEFPVAVKFESKTSVKRGSPFKLNQSTVDVHQMLSDAGLSTTLLAYSVNDECSLPNFSVETVGVVCFDLAECMAVGDNYWAFANSVDGAGGHMAKLAAKLHKRVDVQWFDTFRAEIIECCPLMKNVRNNSPMWVMMRPDHLAKERTARLAECGGQGAGSGTGGGTEGGGKEANMPRKTFNKSYAHAPIDNDLNRFLAVLPEPSGHYASRTVTVHGDMWAANVVVDAANQARLIDLEGVTVSCAVTELAQFGHQRAVSKVYLQEAMDLDDSGSVPTEEEIDQFWLEVLIAAHVQCDILRRLCWHGCQEDDWGETSVRKLFAHAERFSALVDILRKDSKLAMRILRKAAAEGAEGDWCKDEVMDEVLGKVPQEDLSLLEDKV